MRAPHRLRSCALVCNAALALSCALASAEEPARAALRVGWAYGLGAELEVRPCLWGIGLSAGYVPGLGFGGYLSATFGQRSLAQSGLVAEAGGFRGVHNPLRVADDGFGVYAQAGYQHRLLARWSLRVVAGGGLPLTDADHLGSFEFLAKLTFGVAL